MEKDKKSMSNSTQRATESELVQQSLMDNLPCGAGIYEFKDGHISLTYQNKVYWDIVGLNEEAFPDESEMSAIHPDDIPLIMNELTSAIQQHRDVMCDIRLRHLTLGYRPVHLLGRIVFKEGGGFLIYTTFTPIPQVVLEARQQQKRMALLMNSIPGGIAVFEGKPTDLHAIKLTYFSDGFCALFGYTREEYAKLYEVSPLDLVEAEDMERMYEHITKLVRDGIPMDFIYRNKMKGGDIKWINVKASMGEPNGENLTVNAVFLEMNSDEAKRLAEAREHSEQLSTALHAAQMADLAKSHFLSFMSHEIRTPLNAILGYVSIAQSEMSKANTDEERRQVSMKVFDCLDKSQTASRHLLTIINNVLDMSAIESGKMKVVQSPFDFRSLISSLTVMYFSQAKAKGVDFSVHFNKPTEEWFIGDSLRVNQVLTNLLSNAVKFTFEGGSISLTVTEEYVDDQTTRFSFVVADTGIGMSRDYLEHIWEPFEQAEGTITRRFGGSGLGLSITKNLVDLLGGSIAVSSKLDKGTEFKVELTFQRTNQPYTDSEIDFSTVNALVVDDDVGVCEYIKSMFNKCNAKCVAVTSGHDAIKIFTKMQKKGQPFNLCLVDWRMPHMDGFATISKIREVAQENLPIVVVSAYDYEEVAGKVETLGVDRFIAKPFFQSSLFDLLATLYGKRTSHSKRSTFKYNFDGARVLLVEDNIMNMEVAKYLLSSVNLTIDCAWNGQEAVDIFSSSEAGTYKAIFMDVHMPVLNGYQATRKIRESGREDAKSVPIIAMTADAFADDIEQASKAGMNDHISKPVNADSLFKMLHSLL